MQFILYTMITKHFYIICYGFHQCLSRVSLWLFPWYTQAKSALRAKYRKQTIQDTPTFKIKISSKIYLGLKSELKLVFIS